MAIHVAQAFFALVMLADDDGSVVAQVDCDECAAALDVLEDLGLVEIVGESVRVTDIEDYERGGEPRLLADQITAVMRERCA